MTPTSTEPAATSSAPKSSKTRTKAKPPVGSPDDTVTMTRAQLEELVARVAGTAAPVAGGPAAVLDGISNGRPSSSPVTNGDFLDAVRAIIAETRPAQKITVANRVALNPMNPTNEVRKWKKPFYQNFEEVEVEDVTPLEYELIPQLKQGLFIKSRKGIPLVEVVIVKRGPQNGIHLRYDNSKKDRGMELMTYAPSLEVMLQKCIAEYKVQQDTLAKRRAAGLPDESDED